MPKLCALPRMPVAADPSIIAPFTEAIRNGHPVSTAATCARIAESTAYTWLRDGAAELQAAEQAAAELGEDPPGEVDALELGSHVPFLLAYKEAEAALLSRCLAPVNDQIGKGNWVTGMTLAERRFPQDFSRRTEVSVKSESVVVHVTDQLSEATQAKIWEIAARAAEQKALPPPE